MPLREFGNIRRVLVLKLRHIGDVLLTVPAIRALKETFPGASVSALVNSGTEEMLTLNPLVEEVIPFDRSRKGSIAEQMKFAAALRSKRFDMTVDLTGGDRPALTGFLTGARYRLGFDPRGRGFFGKRYLYTHLADPAPLRTHTVLRDLGLLRAFGITTGDLTVDLHTSPDDDRYVRDLLAERDVPRPFVHVHPTSRWLFKCWEDASFAEVMDRLSASGVGVVVTSGPAGKEREKIASIRALMKSSPVDLSGDLGLKQLAALSREAALFLGVDTAPMHMAAAVGTPVVGIFGPSGVFDWGPWDNEAARSLGDGKGAASPYPARSGPQSFGRNTAIQLAWDCIPCGEDGCGGSKVSDCLVELTPDEVWGVIREKIDIIQQS